MTFQFLDVGMGDGTLVQINDGTKTWDELVLVDFGELKTQSKVPYADAQTYLVNTIAANSTKRGKKVPYVDYLFLTHGDPDHFNKVKGLCGASFPGFGTAKLHFGDLYYSGQKGDYDILGANNPIDFIATNNLCAERIANMKSPYHAKVTKTGVTADFELGGKEVSVFILSANYPDIDGDTNPKSIVLMFDLNGQSVILCGDATRATEKEIIKQYASRPTFLPSYGMKIGHHGSKESSRKEWVAAVKPKAIFASGDFVWEHPYCEAICRYINSPGVVPPFFGDDVWYCCGDGGSYYNNATKRPICMNLWYVVSQKKESLRDDRSKKRFTGYENNVFGVQWQLKIEKGADPAFTTTYAVVPVKPVAAAFDCSTVKSLEA